MRTGTIQQVVTLFKESFEQLQVAIPLTTLEDLAIMIDKAMSTEGRIYHTLGHVFDLANKSDPIIALAALFHDSVYYQVDGGFIPEVQAIIAPYIREEKGEIHLSRKIKPDDTNAHLTIAIFGLEPGRKLEPVSGMNEFLSALVMNKSLEGILSLQYLVRISACIEATIPFRGKNAQGETSFDRLARRIDQYSQAHKLEFSLEQITQIVQKAVVFSNRDVGSFGEADAARFLATTWKLLPETNATLRSREIYSIKDYRQALQKMDSFLNSLDPENVFNYYRGVPSEAEMDRMVRAAYENVKTGRDYLDVKLLAISILEALAETTGGDAPLAMFMGALQNEDAINKRLEQFLPEIKPAPDVVINSPLYHLLVTGRADDTDFDIRHSPLTLFIYKCMGPSKIFQAFEQAQKMFSQQITTRQFLASIDRNVVAAIARACAEVVITRREALLEFV